jgi:hypothetical protein
MIETELFVDADQPDAAGYFRDISDFANCGKVFATHALRFPTR